MSESRHLHRLDWIWDRHSIYFITTCAAGRRPLLARPEVHDILKTEWAGLKERHGWAVGRYVIMPDHVHFFVSPLDEKASLSGTVGSWKEWTSKHVRRAIGLSSTLWQAEFFDHMLRSTESFSEKWQYVQQYPVRAGLVKRADDWPYAGFVDFE